MRFRIEISGDHDMWVADVFHDQAAVAFQSTCGPDLATVLTNTSRFVEVAAAHDFPLASA